MSCEAAWAFAYGGQLSQGDTLKRRQMASILSDGRAWGAAVAAWHMHSGELFAGMDASRAMRASFMENVQEMAQRGHMVDLASQVDSENRLEQVLEHYMSTAAPLGNLTRLEDEIDVPIPSRQGRRGSSRYRFMCRIDGYTIDAFEGHWLVEYKLRGQLQDVQQILLGRQPRWYAWAHQQETGVPIVGVIIDERLNDAPKPPRMVKGKRKGEGPMPSHAKDQLCTPEDYRAVCEEHGVDPHEDTYAHLAARRWQQRVPILFRPNELEEAGRELVSAAKLIRDLDSGDLFPIRNAKPSNCRSCEYLQICADPSDELFVDTLFTRSTPKKDKPPRDGPSINVETIETMAVPW